MKLLNAIANVNEVSFKMMPKNISDLVPEVNLFSMARIFIAVILETRFLFVLLELLNFIQTK